jgi:MFS transporter, DHA1 family, multidrug resistance protein
MTELIRDTAFGQLVRLVSRNRYFQFPEERNPSLWKKYVNVEKSANAARYGQLEEPENEVEEDSEKYKRENDGMRHQHQQDATRSTRSNERSPSSQSTAVNSIAGVRVDPEKGKDVHVVDWYGPDDPEVCLSSELCISFIWKNSC